MVERNRRCREQDGVLISEGEPGSCVGVGGGGGVGGYSREEGNYFKVGGGVR